jgi:hypothetical protein
MRKSDFLGKISEEILLKITRYSAPQILAILRQADGGVPVSELCREHGMHGPAEYCETMFERGATRRSTNGGQSMAEWMRR